MKYVMILGLSLAFFSAHSQASKARANKNIQIVQVADKTMPADEARITFKFVGPDNKPAIKHVKVVCNYDSAYPEIDAAGNYTVAFDPGKYKMRFSVPFWHDVKTDSIFLKKQTATTLVIRFQAKDIK